MKKIELEIQNTQLEEAEQRRAQRLLMMVHELHKVGYQKIQIFPYMAPSGFHWRCTITTSNHIGFKHGFYKVIQKKSQVAATYTSATENVYFGWEDAKQDNARQLAQKFIQRFPEIARQGKGLDYAYAGWLTLILGYTENGHFPIFFEDSPNQAPEGYMLNTSSSKTYIPAPPLQDRSTQDRN